MIGQVKVAAGNVCAECPDSAVQIKLVRVAFLFFLVPLAVYLSKKEEKKFNYQVLQRDMGHDADLSEGLGIHQQGDRDAEAFGLLQDRGDRVP
jgi:hypothetical protein